MLTHEFFIIQSDKSDVLMPQMMGHPHGKQKSDIGNTIDTEYFNRVFYREISISIEGNEQEGGKTQDFPTNKHGFQIAGEYDNIVTKEKEKDITEESMVSFFTMQVISTIHHHHKG